MPRPALAKTTYAADVLDDFTHGLDLSPVQQVPHNGVTLARDVDFSARGGFSQRCGIVPFDYATPKAGDTLYIMGTHNRVEDGVQQVFALTVSEAFAYWSAGGGWFQAEALARFYRPFVCPSGSSVPGIIGGKADGIANTVMAQYSNKSYFQSGFAFARRWNGYVMTTLGQAFNDNIAAPTGGNMPVARCVAAHREYVFVANTDEGTMTSSGGGAIIQDYKPRRLRWSHPGQPEDWRSFDFIDLPNGTIRALLPFQDFLMVFTDDEVYGLYGSSADDFALQRLSGDTGTQWAKSVTRGPGRAYWWDWDNGVMCYDGRRIFSVFDNLSSALQTGQFSWGAKQNGLDDIVELCWADGRLYVAKQVVPTDLGLTLVFDPGVGKGAWTTYDWGGFSSEFGNNGIVGGMTTVPRPSNFDLMIAGLGTRCYITNDQTYDLDYFGGAMPTIPTAPRMLVRTAAMAGSTNATQKRFRRPRMALRSGATQSFAYRWVRDYDPTAAKNHTAADYIEVILDNVTNRKADYAVWNGVGPAGVGSLAQSNTLSPVVANVLNTANATAATVTSGAFTTSLNDVILVTYAAYDDSGTTMSADIVESMAGTVYFNKFEKTFVNGGKSAVFGGFITKCPAGGAGATVQVNIPGADDIAIVVYRLDNAQARIITGTYGTGNEVPAAGGVGTLVTGDPSFVTTNDQNFIMVVVAELTNSDIDLNTFTTDIEDNNANNILGLGHRQATAGSVSCGWQYMSGTNTWGCAFGFIVPGLSLATDGEWNTDKWGGTGVDEFIQFETEPSAGAGHVVQLEIRNTFSGDASVRSNGVNGINDSFGMDSTIVPYREKGLR